MIKTFKKKAQIQPLEPEEKHLTIEEAINFVQDELVKLNFDGAIFDQAVAGVLEAKENAVKEIDHILTLNKVGVDEYEENAACEIYDRAWGLGAVEDLYRDKSIDEIRINDHDKIFVSQKGKNKKSAITFNSAEDIDQVISRCYAHDTGISLTQTTPVVESVREDGTRLTAICRPVTNTTIGVLRKHNTFEVTIKNLCDTGTMDKRTWDILSFLVRGRANILIIGGFGSGKTTLQRRLIKELPETLRVVTLESDRELRMRTHYPERDIVELEEHANLEGASLKELLRTTFRLSPDVIIVGEFRGAGEAVEAVKSCRVLRGSMATAHFSSAEEAIEGTAMLMLEEGLNLPFELAKIRVARAYNIAVEMFSDTEKGVKKLIKVNEICVDESINKVYYRTLVEWEPEGEDYVGAGRWVLRNKPSKTLLSLMARYIPIEREVETLWG